MTSKRKFLLDADTFIQAKNRHYAFDICPGYWTAILRLHEKGCVFSIDRVKSELIKGADELSEWIKRQVPAAFFRNTENQAVIGEYRKIVGWVNNQTQYYPDAKSGFVSGADPWLIAYARAYGHVVVTHEQHKPEARNTVPIPNVCICWDVEWKDPFQMLRELEVKFVLVQREMESGTL